MEEKTISYFKIVKYIHPDWNPDVKEPDKKMEEAINFRNDEKKLYKLAVKWGFIEDSEADNFEPEYKISEGKIVKINKKDDGIIVDVIKNKKNDQCDVIVSLNKKFQRFKRSKEFLQDEDFYVVGFADDQQYINEDFKYQMRIDEFRKN